MANEKEQSPLSQARAVDEASRKAERKRMEAVARATPTRGPIPAAAKGRVRYVASEDTVSPDGKHHRRGEVFSVPEDVEPSLGWDNFEDRLAEAKKGKS